ncbi:hypothetical protein [Nitrosomonas sp. Nm166]|uniref:hypothetical protein n=1 Tax=Nitrosomonas sp. Nm166 TaxID=1881054 RepID=UPI0008ED8B21|nr:hypothetical protein [Nitrosomonas sp. Nm166]SFF22709.1 hypothetical protein SAMN05428977_10763 [Nitrosomonas sp. Nm166]
MDSRTPKNETFERAINDSYSENPGVIDDIQLLWHELRALNHAHFRLAALEARVAGNSLVIMIVAGLVIAILLSVAWLGLLAATVLALDKYGILTDNILSILLAVALNLLLVLILWRVIHNKSYYLQFPATIRNLKFILSGPRNMEKK